MGGSIYDIIEELDEFDEQTQGPFRPHHSAYYPATQALQRKSQDRSSLPSRTRYSQYSHGPRGPHDSTGEDVQLGQDMPLDVFDKELLRQPYEDRQRQAEQGRARLSLGPNPSRHFGGGASQSQVASAEFERDPIETEYEKRCPQVRDINQYAYNLSQKPESSSDFHGLSSSPAFKASQRHKGDSQSIRRPSKRALEEDDAYGPTPPPTRKFKPAFLKAHQREAPKPMSLKHAPPTAQGIALLAVTELPDRLRSVFSFPLFNAVQSKCFERVYRSDDNFVLSSPTGSGKTAILELAICRTINNRTTGQFKIVYQAPTKSLCSERQRDWQKKFGPLGLKCEELTGDSDNAHLRNIQSASIIVTTPEKWDSVTRKWKDHEKLMSLIKLFLIDEVHILKDDRGATLEAVVSRMKTVGTDVRFVALSATVPNFEDVATWLGKSPMQQGLPANHERFGEEFRPVKLKKHVCGYSCNTGNEFVFEKVLDSKLPDVITKYSARKPIMVFCFTRNSTASTARLLANWWTTRNPRDRLWTVPAKQHPFINHDLRSCAAAGVAFHHAGLDANDRLAVEDGFLKGEINVICCTSTLAVGVNLPCHLVIIKNTVSWTNTGAKEYPDLEIIQMLGRAGRPQFDDSGVAVILTRQHKARHYELMVSGQELLESCLHLNLVDHLNAEVGLGTITDLLSARKWLAGTFLYVRLKQNADHYKLEGSRNGQDIDEQLDDICNRDINLLKATNLVENREIFNCTEFGHIMARYYVQFGTMAVFLGLPPRPKISEILSALAQAQEFKEVRFRSGEKSFYKRLNGSSSIRFPIAVDIALPAHKISLILQSVLGSVDLDWNDQNMKHKAQYTLEMSAIFKHINRLVRCIIDCQNELNDSVGMRNGLLLECSLGARTWDDGPMQMKQIDQLGVVSVRKLVNAGITTIEELESTEPHRLEMILSKNPPFGMKFLDRLKSFPKLRVSVQLMPTSFIKCNEGLKVRVKAEIGFMNEKPSVKYREKPVYVCFLAETSDGEKVHFARISGQKLGNGQDLIFPVLLTNSDQCINCYVMCDEFAGTMRQAIVKPKVAPSIFPPQKSQQPHKQIILPRPASNTSKRRIEPLGPAKKLSSSNDEFGDSDIDDSDLVQAAGTGDLDFDHIDNYGDGIVSLTRNNTIGNSVSKTGKSRAAIEPECFDEPRQLENGKWACNHKCKDKNTCKHGACCREGLDKPPKKVAKKVAASTEVSSTQRHPDELSKKLYKADKAQTKLKLPVSQGKTSTSLELLDLTQQDKRKNDDYTRNGPAAYQSLHKLHVKMQKRDPPSSISAVMHKKPAYSYAAGGEPSLSFLPHDNRSDSIESFSSDYGVNTSDEYSSHFDSPGRNKNKVTIEEPIGCATDDLFEDPHSAGGCVEEDTIGQLSDQALDDDHDSLLDAALIGLADSQDLQDPRFRDEDDLRALFEAFETEKDDKHGERSEYVDADQAAGHIEIASGALLLSPSRLIPPVTSRVAMQSNKGPFIESGSPRSRRYEGFRPANTMLDRNGMLSKMEQMGEKKRMICSKEMEAVSPCENEKALPKMKEKDVGKRRNNVHEEEIAAMESPGAEDIEPWLMAEFGDIVEIV